MEKLVKTDYIPECPFLINNVCSVYKYRGLICRMFGLLLIDDVGEYTVPFCVHNGLNYANIFDESSQKLSTEKIKRLNPTNDPTYHNITREKLFSLQIAKDLGLEPGISKPLKMWLKDFYNQKEGV